MLHRLYRPHAIQLFALHWHQRWQVSAALVLEANGNKPDSNVKRNRTHIRSELLYVAKAAVALGRRLVKTAASLAAELIKEGDQFFKLKGKLRRNNTLIDIEFQNALSDLVAA